MKQSRIARYRVPALLTPICIFLFASLFFFTVPVCGAYNETRITASDGTPNAYFGQAVATGEKMIVVGAPYADSNKGAVYVYRYDGDAWVETKLSGKDTGIVQFGHSVAVSGNIIVVGAPYGNSRKGAIYIYRYNGLNWEETRITASDGAERDCFGYSVTISGKTVVAGAPYADSDKGKAYVYKYDGLNWTETKLTASDGTEGDHFGYSVAISGNLVIVQAPHSKFSKGATYIYSPE
jgi:hypothetical protein